MLALTTENITEYQGMEIQMRDHPEYGNWFTRFDGRNWNAKKCNRPSDSVCITNFGDWVIVKAGN